MKIAIIPAALLTLALGLAPARAEQTVPEKAAVVKNDAVRAVKKAVHRAQELVCLESDAECMARKAKHRVVEAVDATADKVEEVKDKVDGK